MRKTIVIYNSKTGYTKKYAEWIAIELDAEICEQRDFNSERCKNLTPSYLEAAFTPPG